MGLKKALKIYQLWRLAKRLIRQFSNACLSECQNQVIFNVQQSRNFSRVSLNHQEALDISMQRLNLHVDLDGRQIADLRFLMADHAKVLTKKFDRVMMGHFAQIGARLESFLKAASLASDALELRTGANAINPETTENPLPVQTPLPMASAIQATEESQAEIREMQRQARRLARKVNFQAAAAAVILTGESSVISFFMFDSEITAAVREKTPHIFSAIAQGVQIPEILTALGSGIGAVMLFWTMAKVLVQPASNTAWTVVRNACCFMLTICCAMAFAALRMPRDSAEPVTALQAMASIFTQPGEIAGLIMFLGSAGIALALKQLMGQAHSNHLKLETKLGEIDQKRLSMAIFEGHCKAKRTRIYDEIRSLRDDLFINRAKRRAAKREDGDLNRLAEAAASEMRQQGRFLQSELVSVGNSVLPEMRQQTRDIVDDITVILSKSISSQTPSPVKSYDGNHTARNGQKYRPLLEGDNSH